MKIILNYMGFLKGIIENSKNRNRRLKEAQEEERIQRKVHERNLGHNEREFNKMLEQERQKEIAYGLKFMNFKRRWEDNQKSRQMMQFNANLWSDNNNILSW